MKVTNNNLGRNTMNMLRTDKTYKTYANAIVALRKACTALGVDFDYLRYVVAVNEAGRFAPAVVWCGGTIKSTSGGIVDMPTNAFCTVCGITVIA